MPKRYKYLLRTEFFIGDCLMKQGTVKWYDSKKVMDLFLPMVKQRMFLFM